MVSSYLLLSLRQDGDRLDNVASRGLAKSRVEAINRLPGNPVVFVLNIQIPGDPPVSGIMLNLQSLFNFNHNQTLKLIPYF